jgi:hypothetical protein
MYFWVHNTPPSSLIVECVGLAICCKKHKDHHHHHPFFLASFCIGKGISQTGGFPLERETSYSYTSFHCTLSCHALLSFTTCKENSSLHNSFHINRIVFTSLTYTALLSVGSIPFVFVRGIMTMDAHLSHRSK